MINFRSLCQSLIANLRNFFLDACWPALIRLWHTLRIVFQFAFPKHALFILAAIAIAGIAIDATISANSMNTSMRRICTTASDLYVKLELASLRNELENDTSGGANIARTESDPNFSRNIAHARNAFAQAVESCQKFLSPTLLRDSDVVTAESEIIIAHRLLFYICSIEQIQQPFVVRLERNPIRYLRKIWDWNSGSAIIYRDGVIPEFGPQYLAHACGWARNTGPAGQETGSARQKIIVAANSQPTPLPEPDFGRSQLASAMVGRCTQPPNQNLEDNADNIGTEQSRSAEKQTRERQQKQDYRIGLVKCFYPEMNALEDSRIPNEEGYVVYLAEKSREINISYANLVIASIDKMAPITDLIFIFLLPMLYAVTGSALAAALPWVSSQGAPAVPAVQLGGIGRPIVTALFSAFTGLIIGLIYNEIISQQVTYSPAIVAFFAGFGIDGFANFLRRAAGIFSS